MKRQVFVTGLGVVSPIGVGIETFYDGLRNARGGIRAITAFDAGRFPTRIAGEVDAPLTPPGWLSEDCRSAMMEDRKIGFGVVAADQALSEAFGNGGPTDFYDPRRVSAFIATGLEAIRLPELVRHFDAGGLNRQSLFAGAGDACPGPRLLIPSHLAAMAIARRAGARGRLAVNVSACAAGTQAIGEAFMAIRNGIADVAITGGYDSMINPIGIGGFSVLGALSRANALVGGASRPFDARRDGFVLGEGGAMMVLEAADTARKRGAIPHARILGYASSLDAFRLADPPTDGRGARAAMAAALKQAGLAPERIDYINAHGTGTPKNDAAETRAIRSLFGPHADRIPVSSLKSQIGHLIGAAGAVEFIAGIFALTRNLLPATINLEQPDPACDLDYVPNVPRPARIETFLSNSFGFGGQNAVIVAGAAQP